MNEVVLCIDDRGAYNLDEGKTYRVVEKSIHNAWYVAIDNTGNEKEYSGRRFKEVKENEMQKMQEVTAQNMVKNRSYIVGSFDSNGNFSISSNPSEHLSEQKAKTEAKRLAGLYSEKTFVVMQLKAGFKVAAVQEI